MSELRLSELEAAGSATVSRWLKQPGEAVGAYEKLVEVFTEHFDWDILSPHAGVLREIVAAEGVQVPSGAVLAILDGEAAIGEPSAPPGARAMRISPLAAKIAADRQVDLERAHGSGPAGRVSKEDVLTLLQASAEQRDEAAAQPATQGVVGKPSTQTGEAAAQQGTQPQSAVEAVSTGRPPAVTTFIAVDMTHISTQREARLSHWLQREGFGLDYLPYVVAATVEALRSQPLGAGVATPYEAGQDAGIDVEVAHAAGSTHLHHAESYNLVGIARRLQSAGTTREGAGQPAFVIEDRGAGGALLTTGLLAADASGLLTVGRVQKQAVAAGDALQSRPMAYLGLAFDPQKVDEGKAVRFMAELKRQLETVSFS